MMVLSKVLRKKKKKNSLNIELVERLLDGDLKLQKAMLWNVFISNTSMMEWSLLDIPDIFLFIKSVIYIWLYFLCLYERLQDAC